MKRIFLTLVVMFTVVGAAAAPAAAHPPPDRTTLQQDADVLLDHGAPGVIAEVVTPAGSATVRAGEGVPRHAKFRIGSLTKTYVSATVLQLVGDGRLALSNPVEKWLPGMVRGAGNDGRRITVRQLLQQTSGLPNYTDNLTFLFTEEGFRANRDRVTTPEELVALALQHPPKFAPGTSWDYSNTNYLLAGMIIERVTGHSWETEVAHRILRPLGLRDTSIPRTSPDVPEPHAVGYHRFPGPGATETDPKFGEPIDATRMSPSWADAAGSMISTTTDTNRFLRALLGGRVLRPAQLAEMTKTVRATPFSDSWTDPRYGLGLLWSATPCGGMWSHGGDIPGYKTRDGVDEHGTRSVVVSLNTDSIVPKPGALDPTTDLVNHALCG